VVWQHFAKLLLSISLYQNPEGIPREIFHGLLPEGIPTYVEPILTLGQMTWHVCSSLGGKRRQTHDKLAETSFGFLIDELILPANASEQTQDQKPHLLNEWLHGQSRKASPDGSKHSLD
jgi:hypothetical protein